MEYTVHHVLVDSAHRDASQPNWEYTALLGNEGALKNVVAVSLLGCVIPHADSNIRADACQIYLREYYHMEGIWRYVTASVMPGFYATLENYRAAIRSALARAERAPPLTSANDQPEYDLVYYENSHAALRITDKSPSTNAQPERVATLKSGRLVSFAPVLDMDRRTPLYRLGFDARHELHGASDIDATRALFVSNRLVDISTTDYVDIDIPELPDAALKMTTQTRRVFARVPTARSGSRTVHDLTDRNVIRRHFFPVQMWRVTVRLFDQYGQPFANNDADHTLDLEVVTVNHELPAALRWQPRGAAAEAPETIEVDDDDDAPAPPAAPLIASPPPQTTPRFAYVAGGAALGGALGLVAVVAAWRRWRRPPTTRLVEDFGPVRAFR